MPRSTNLLNLCVDESLGLGPPRRAIASLPCGSWRSPGAGDRPARPGGGGQAHLGDDRLGRALDHLFDADRAALLTEIVVAVGQQFEVQFDQLHNDSTSVAFCGQYRAARGRELRGRTAPAITYGHSKDHRPDLKHWAESQR